MGLYSGKGHSVWAEAKVLQIWTYFEYNLNKATDYDSNLVPSFLAQEPTSCSIFPVDYELLAARQKWKQPPLLSDDDLLLLCIIRWWNVEVTNNHMITIKAEPAFEPVSMHRLMSTVCFVCLILFLTDCELSDQHCYHSQSPSSETAEVWIIHYHYNWFPSCYRHSLQGNCTFCIQEEGSSKGLSDGKQVSKGVHFYCHSLCWRFTRSMDSIRWHSLSYLAVCLGCGLQRQDSTHSYSRWACHCPCMFLFAHDVNLIILFVDPPVVVRVAQ